MMFGTKLGFSLDKRPLLLRLYHRIVGRYHAHDINYVLQMMARDESAQYAKARMASTIIFQGRWLPSCGRRRPRGYTWSSGWKRARVPTS